jgi:predicted lipid-binding transport protein (Tim44 family)
LRVVDFSLVRELRFVGGMIAGVGAGGLIGYGLGWDQTLGLKPAFMSLPCLGLMAVGQTVAWRAVRRSRQMDEDKPQNG